MRPSTYAAISCPATRIGGPAIIAEQNATTVVEPGWQADLTARDHLVLDPRRPAAARACDRHRGRPGAARGVQQPVHGDRRADGRHAREHGVFGEHQGAPRFLVRPVRRRRQPDRQRAAHAGAPGLHGRERAHHHRPSRRDDASWRRVRAQRPVQRRHAPARRDGHRAGLPRRRRIAGVLRRLARSSCRHRRHDAGSMPPDSTHVDEEGVLLDNVQLVAEGRFLESEMRAILGSGRYPARNVEQNLADLRAQVAACAKGAAELERMVGHFGLDVVRAYMRHVQDNAEEAVRRVLDVLADGSFEYEMDSGARIAVTIRIDKPNRSATVDFTGTSAQQPTNFNAPSAVCKAAVLYVFRTLVDDDIPMNAGCLKPIRIVIPEGSMLAPRYPAAVVAGNVETSQAITDTLYGALGVLAASQGTMNNFTFGNDRYQYYETIAGGSGRRAGFRRRERRADAHDQLAPHRSGGARVALSGASGAFRHPSRQRRRRPAPRRRRRRAPRTLPRTDDGRDARQSPPRRALRGRRRSARGGRPQLGRARRRHAGGHSAPPAPWRWARATCSSSKRPAAAASARPRPRMKHPRTRSARSPQGGSSVASDGRAPLTWLSTARRRARRGTSHNRALSKGQAMASVYDFTVNDIHGKPVKLDRYRGKVLLIVNTASECGFTPQYKGLEGAVREVPRRGPRSPGLSVQPVRRAGARRRRRDRASSASSTTA